MYSTQSISVLTFYWDKEIRNLEDIQNVDIVTLYRKPMKNIDWISTDAILIKISTSEHLIIYIEIIKILYIVTLYFIVFFRNK